MHILQQFPTTWLDYKRCLCYNWSNESEVPAHTQIIFSVRIGELIRGDTMKRIALLLLAACIMLSGCGENSDNIIDFNSSTLRGDAGITDIPNIIISEEAETEQAESEESQAAESIEILNISPATTEVTEAAAHTTTTPRISTTAPQMTAASKPEATAAQTSAATKSTTAAETKISTNKVAVPEQEEYVGNPVWVPTNGGRKYHRKSSCSKMIDPMQVTVETAVANGFTPCKKCY